MALDPSAPSPLLSRHVEDFDRALTRLAEAPAFSRFSHLGQVFARAAKLLAHDDGVAALYARASQFGPAGVFAGSDWDAPATLQPALVGPTLRAGGDTAVLECLSELRMLALAEGQASVESIDQAAAHDFVSRVLAANLDLLFPTATETDRDLSNADAARIRRLFDFMLGRLGAGAILDDLLAEVATVMAQRPVMAARAEALLEAAGRALADETVSSATADIARHWLAALKAPSALARSTTVADYRRAISDCDADQLAAEAGVFAAAMNETGLVSAQHAVLLLHVLDSAPDLVPVALGLDGVGRICLDATLDRLAPIIRQAIRPATARAIYGLARLLNSGRLFDRSLMAGLQRLSRTVLHHDAAAALDADGDTAPGSVAAGRLVAATLAVLGQPRGVDQGHNPTCQSARAISLWAQNDPGYLLDLIARVARDNDLIMDFEGRTIQASTVARGMVRELHPELDPVSRLLTPHLDRIYVEMGRCTVGRIGDGHRWVNPEMHGWWVLRDFAALIALETGAITRCDAFLRLFYSAYHPEYNGGRDLIHVQPCGIASTNPAGAWVGWHAIAIQRVARDSTGSWRVYFYNPNRDKAQNWGQGIVTSTHEADELEGESSLLFEQFAARLYLFHYRAAEVGDPALVPDEHIAAARELIVTGWGEHFAWQDD